MTFTRTEKLIVLIGFKLTLVVGFFACLGLTASFFIGRPAGPKALVLFGALLAVDLVAMAYLALCQALVGKSRGGEGA
ncbi:hypothetical protein [Caulobacter sp.]|uniref:hypothetical protein n=1 Tax=Caulobacter sp. TaxID=78 RepID=UPI0031DB4BB2